MNADTVKALHGALTGMLTAIGGAGEPGGAENGGGATIADRLAAIDALTRELGPEDPAMLKHYLEKRSYEKALDFLEGCDEASEPGC